MSRWLPFLFALLEASALAYAPEPPFFSSFHPVPRLASATPCRPTTTKGNYNRWDLVEAVTDRPWKTMLGEMMKSNYDIYKVFFGDKEPFRFKDPRFEPAAKKAAVGQ